MAIRERVLTRPPGRRPNFCRNLPYSDIVNERRKAAGRRIKRLRRQAGFKSAKAFAESIGSISETSVARAEAGYDNVGDGVYGDIETALKLTPGAIADYLETGDSRLLDAPLAAAGEVVEDELPAVEVHEAPDGGGAEQPEVTLADVQRKFAAVQREQDELMAMISRLDQQKTRKAE